MENMYNYSQLKQTNLEAKKSNQRTAGRLMVDQLLLM